MSWSAYVSTFVDAAQCFHAVLYGSVCLILITLLHIVEIVHLFYN